ncbi:hypothetical protein NLI96_g12258 [Meripilus lineatus]|uniref:Uncharacterized protein n=1 Tax=Meripilus lineatus TaxID=2056292 RepID=A0AAD5Y8C9_9APHY|nr:hypothetical protein NLI96_g12258 [Physisporinus lineatus]
MSYYASMHPPVDPPTPVLTFPVSSSRDEPYTAYPSSSSSQRYDPLRMLAPPPPFPPLDPAYAQYAVKRRRQIFPGILEDGCLTIGHKFVDIYLERVARAPNDRHTHRLEPDNFFGEKRREYQSVADLLGIRQPLSQKQNDCIFTLAALKVFHTPHHPAHFTFWGKEACKKTAEKVQNILNMSPCPISAPFGWLGITENVWLVDGIQAISFPPRPATKKPNGMTLRKRKAREISKDEGDAAAPSLIDHALNGYEQPLLLSHPTWLDAAGGECAATQCCCECYADYDWFEWGCKEQGSKDGTNLRVVIGRWCRVRTALPVSSHCSFTLEHAGIPLVPYWGQ